MLEFPQKNKYVSLAFIRFGESMSFMKSVLRLPILIRFIFHLERYSNLALDSRLGTLVIAFFSF